MKSAEQRITLIAAGTAARRQEQRAEALSLTASVDWPQLEETLRVRRLLPTLGPRVLELVGDNAKESFSSAVEESLAAGRRHGGFLSLVSQRIAAALASAGIRSQPLKGPALSESIYGDPGRRLSNDVDLLVSADQLGAAVGVVRGLGYQPPADSVDSTGLPQLHFALVHEQGELPPVELHWRVHWYERDFARERLLPPSVDPLGGWRPDPAAELVGLLQFYARDGFIDLRMAADIGAWWDAFGDELREGAMDEIVASYPRLRRVVHTALSVAERTVGLPATKLTGNMPKLDRRDRLAIRLADPNPRGSEAQLHAEMGLVDGLLMPRGDLRAFARRQILLPSHDVPDQRGTGEAIRGAGSRLRYAARVVIRCGVLGRYALAIVRARKARPEALPSTRKVVAES